jgi:four helix bundle protein
MARDFHKVKAWTYADDLAVAVYAATRAFPREERYGLTQQLRRAVVSAPSNIAEGCSRESQADYFRFCAIARGSLSEARYQLHLARRLGYLSEDACACLDAQADVAARALHGLMEAIRKQL